jgi:hypothetical protein
MLAGSWTAIGLLLDCYGLLVDHSRQRRETRAVLVPLNLVLAPLPLPPLLVWFGVKIRLMPLLPKGLPIDTANNESASNPNKSEKWQINGRNRSRMNIARKSCESRQNISDLAGIAHQRQCPGLAFGICCWPGGPETLGKRVRPHCYVRYLVCTMENFLAVYDPIDPRSWARRDYQLDLAKVAVRAALSVWPSEGIHSR